MFVNIIPAIHSIRGVDYFTYAVPEEMELQRGTMVWVPWRNHKVMGVVWEVDVGQPAFAVKFINQVTEIVLPEAYCQFIAWFAEYYHIALSHAVKTIIPPLLRRHTNIKPVAVSANPISLRVAKKNLPAIQALTNRLAKSLPQPHTIIYRTISEPVSIILGLLKNTKQRLAVIVPEEYLIAILAQACQRIVQPTVVSSRLNTTQLFQAWLSMLQRQQRLFIGTRRLSLFPLHQVNTVIMIDPEATSHKQWEMNPRYHPNTVTEYFWKHQHTRLVHFSQSPTVAQIHTDKVRTDLMVNHTEPNITIIDLNNSYDSAYHGLLSPSLLNQCTVMKTMFLWLNKKGTGTLLYCLDCHNITPDLLTVLCTHCRSLRLVKRGHGTTSLVQALQRAFPERKIYEFTKDTKQIDIDYNTTPIIVATNYALPCINWSLVQYVAVISIDQILAEPHFRANERALQQLVQLRNYTGQLAVQTYAPEHTVFQALRQYYPLAWYQTELQQRQLQGLPPYGHFVTAIHKITKQEQPITSFDSPLWQDSHYMIDREP